MNIDKHDRIIISQKLYHLKKNKKTKCPKQFRQTHLLYIYTIEKIGKKHFLFIFIEIQIEVCSFFFVFEKESSQFFFFICLKTKNLSDNKRSFVK
jgi:hypothetical protein